MGHSHSHKDSDTTQLFGIAALAAGVGALTALLFSKKNGAETRDALRTKIQELKTKPQSIKKDIDEAADNASDMASRAKDQAIDTADEVADKLKNKIDKR